MTRIGKIGKFSSHSAAENGHKLIELFSRNRSLKRGFPLLPPTAATDNVPYASWHIRSSSSDHSEAELLVETLATRLKTADIRNDFHAIAKKVQAVMTDEEPEKSGKKVEPKGFGDQSKPRQK